MSWVEIPIPMVEDHGLNSVGHFVASYPTSR